MRVPQTLLPNPYVGPRSFQAGEALYGRDREISDLLGLVIAERIVLLHSPSGAGKTSLVQAALIPQLEEQEFTILPMMRVNLEPPIVANGERQAPDGVSKGESVPNRYILSALLSIEEQLPPEQQTPLEELAVLTLDAYLNQHPIASSANSTVLIFDQFEEILTVDPTNVVAKADFFAQVGRALRNRQRWALFSMREDYVAALTPYLPHIPTRLNCTYRLDLLSATAAQQAIQQPARGSGVEFAAAAATRLIDDLRRVHVQRPDGSVEEQLGPAVEPVQLQVVCYRLWDKHFSGQRAEAPGDNHEIALADVEAVGDVDSALSDYYAERVAEIAEAIDVRERIIREWFDRALITPQGIRGQVLQGEGQSQGLENLAIRELIDAYLVRAEKRRSATWFELAHDRLIEPIRNDNATWSAAHLSQIQRQADLWDTRNRPDGLLLRDAALVEAEKWAADHADELTSVERDFLEQCRKVREIVQRARRNNRVIRILLIIAVILVGMVSLLLVYTNQQRAIAVAERNYAEQQRQIALSRQLVAQADAASGGPLDLAMLLSQEAGRITDSAETRGSLLSALVASPHLGAYLRSHTSQVQSVAFSPDGKTLASGGDDQTIILWDVAARRPLGQPLRGHQGIVSSVAFSPDGRILASGGFEGAVMLWDVATRQLLGQPLRGRQDPVRSIAFSPDGKTLAAAGDDMSVVLWDVAARQPLGQPLQGHQAAVLSVAFSPSGKLLASAACSQGSISAGTCNQGEIRLWDVATGQPHGKPLIGHESFVASLAFSPDGNTLASGSGDSTIILWDVATGAQRTQLKGHAGPVFSLAFTPDSKTLASGSADKTIRLWDVASQQPAEPALTGHGRAIYSVAFSPDGKTLASGSGDSTIILWDLSARQRLGTVLAKHSDTVGSVAFSPDGKILASGSDDMSILLWDTATHMPVGEPLTGHQSSVNGVAFSPDGKTLASVACGDASCAGGEIRFWDVGTRQQLGPPLISNQQAVDSVAFSPDGKILASGNQDGTIILWDVAARRPLGEPLTGHRGIVWSVAFSPDGKILASGSEDQTIILWDVAARRPLGQPLQRHRDSVSSVAFSPDGKILASGSSDQTIILWDVATRQPLGQPLQGHGNTVNSVAFSPDGKTLASGSFDKTIMLWDVAARQPLGQPLTGHTQGVYTIAFSPDGKTLASGSFDSKIILWDVDPRSWQARACALAGRNLTEEEWGQYVGDGTRQKTCPDLPLQPG